MRDIFTESTNEVTESQWFKDAMAGNFFELTEEELAILKKKNDEIDDKFKLFADNEILSLRGELDRTASEEERLKLTKDWVNKYYVKLLYEWILARVKSSPEYQSKKDYALGDAFVSCTNDVFKKDLVPQSGVHKAVKSIIIYMLTNAEVYKKLLPGIDVNKIAEQIRESVVIE